MRLQARLVHAEAGRRVVLVCAWEGERALGGALGEGADAEEAEDRAVARLLARLKGTGGGGRAPAPAPGPPPAATAQAPVTPVPPAQAPVPAPAAPALSAPAPAAPPPVAPDRPAGLPAAGPSSGPGDSPAGQEASTAPAAPADPEDWSEELAALDLQLRRLGWGREEEATYLQRAFAHPSRSRLTSYPDLLAYLRALEELPAGVEPSRAAIPLRRRDLLAQCDQLLEGLGWGAEEGRRFLERHLGVASRQHLDDNQLLRFNMLLEEEVLGSHDAAPTAAEPGGIPEAAGGG